MSQAHKSKKDPAHGSEKKKEGLGLKMEEEGQACKKKKKALGPREGGIKKAQPKGERKP